MGITREEKAEQNSWMEGLETRIRPDVSPWRTLCGNSSDGEAIINVQAYLPQRQDVTFGLQLQNGLRHTQPKRTLKWFCQPHRYGKPPSVEQRREIQRMLDRFREIRGLLPDDANGQTVDRGMGFRSYTWPRPPGDLEEWVSIIPERWEMLHTAFPEAVSQPLRKDEPTGRRRGGR
jgi:hypothetical protein